MRLDFLPIYKRELRAMLQSWGLYVSLALFFFISALFFDLNLMTFIQESAEQAQQPYAAINNPLNFNESVVVNTFGVMAFLFIFIVPLLTMRLLAEEKQTGTYELLATSPISDWGIVLGKYLSAVTVIVLVTLLSLVFVGFMYWIGQPEGPVVAGCLIGLLVMGAAYSAFGLCASALTQNQMVAAIVSLVGLLTLFLAKQLAPNSSGWWGDVLADISLFAHGDMMLKGMMRLEDLVFFALFAVFFLFLTHTLLQARRWRI
jgi:ABC-2 type transport system permease protein